MPNRNDIYSLLAKADETYRSLPKNIRLLVRNVSQAIPDFGPRKLRRRGPGTEFFEVRDYQKDIDDPRKINARLSAKVGKPMVVEKEAQISQRVYMWRDPTDTMDFSSDEDNIPTKKNAAEIMMFALARHLTKNEEAVGLIDQKGIYRGGQAADNMAGKLYDVRVMTGDKPILKSKPPKNSTAILFSDFIEDPALLEKRLDHLRAQGVGGAVVMVLDPAEIEFNYEGFVEFHATQGELTETFKRAENIREDYIQKISDQIEAVKKVTESKGFDFVFQRTDRPLHHGLMKIYGMKPDNYSPNPAKQALSNG